MFSEKLDKVQSNFKDWTLKISNKFDVGILFQVGIIKIIFFKNH
jgi:hypothetical protein